VEKLVEKPSDLSPQSVKTAVLLTSSRSEGRQRPAGTAFSPEAAGDRQVQPGFAGGESHERPVQIRF
jgi:hypothetical protein